MENMEKSEAGLADLRHAIRGGEYEDLRGSGKKSARGRVGRTYGKGKGEKIFTKCRDEL